MKKAILLVATLTLSLYAKELTLDEAIRMALENNQNLKISYTALQIADAQYQQALSGRYPQLTASMSVSRIDQDPTYKLQGNIALPQEFSGIFGALITDAATSGGVATGTYLSTYGAPSLQAIPMNMDVKLMGQDTALGRLDLIYPLYTGGKVDAIIRQATLNKSIQGEANRRSEAEVIYDVKRYYYGVMLTQKLRAETQATLERLNMVKDLTEAFYKGGSLSVKKTDFLRTVTTVSLIESMVEEMRTNVELSKSALINAIGLPWNSNIETAQNEFDMPKLSHELESLVEDAYRFNPTYAQLKLAIDVQSAKIDEAKSDYLPTIALTGNVQHLANSYNGGLINDTNRNSWTIGVGIKWNLFDGFRTSNAVQEARLNKLNYGHKEVLLKEGLALQVKHAFIKIGQNERQNQSLKKGRDTALENADLNIRAYQEDIVETKDVIESQLMETFTKIVYLKNLHDFSVAQSQLNFIITHEIANLEQK